MKKIVFTVLLFAFSTNSFCQEKTFTKEDYLEKSRRKRTSGFIWLGTGTALVVTGVILINNTKGGSLLYGENDLGKGIGGIAGAGLGGICMLIGGISLNKSQKYKEKAALLTFKNEKAPQLMKNVFASRCYPALSLSIRL